MNKIIDWKDIYRTGIEEIDLQHEYFASLINKLSDELYATDDPVYHGMLFNELIRYALFHFTSEENLMYRYKFANLESHKEIHDSLIDELNIKTNNVQLAKEDTESLINFLADWFLNHTADLDKELQALEISKKN